MAASPNHTRHELSRRLSCPPPDPNCEVLPGPCEIDHEIDIMSAGTDADIEAAAKLVMAVAEAGTTTGVGCACTAAAAEVPSPAALSWSDSNGGDCCAVSPSVATAGDDCGDDCGDGSVKLGGGGSPRR